MDATAHPIPNRLAWQHSQSTEALWAHVPGLKVVMPANPKDAKGLLKSAIRDDNPVVFIEGETLYNSTWEVPTDEYLLPFGPRDERSHDAGVQRRQPAHGKGPQRPDLVGHDRLAALKADYVANGPGRSNLRYGYVTRPA